MIFAENPLNSVLGLHIYKETFYEQKAKNLKHFSDCSVIVFLEFQWAIPEFVFNKIFYTCLILHMTHTFLLNCQSIWPIISTRYIQVRDHMLKKYSLLELNFICTICLLFCCCSEGRYCGNSTVIKQLKKSGSMTLLIIINKLGSK